MTPTSLTTVPTSITAPVTARQVQQAADDWQDVRLSDGRLVYPGSKLAFLIERQGIDKAVGHLNFCAQNMTRPQPLNQVADVRRAIENLKRLADAGEYAEATQLEREIWAGVLEAVATSNAQAGWLADAALTTRDISFPRVSA